MADLNLDKSETALLMADFAIIGIGENPIAQERHTLDRAQEVLNAARSAGIFVCYCISHFRPGFPEVSDRDVVRAARRDSGGLPASDVGIGENPIAQEGTGAVFGYDGLSLLGQY